MRIWRDKRKKEQDKVDNEGKMCKRKKEGKR